MGSRARNPEASPSETNREGSRSHPAASTQLTFLEFVFDPPTRTLIGPDGTVHLEPKANELLHYLLTHRNRVVSKAELSETLWPDVVVTESSLTTCVAKLRRGLGKAEKKVIKSYYGIGYRFVAPCRPGIDEGLAATVASSTEEPYPASTRMLLGRKPELSQLDLAWNDARGGRTRLLLVTGDQGIGKTRLVEAFSDHARAQGALVASGQCSDVEGGDAFRPWNEILRQLTRQASDGGDAKLDPSEGEEATSRASIWHTSRMLAGDADRSFDSAGDPSQERFRLFDRLGGLIRRYSMVRPCVIVVEDIHWADPASVMLLQFLARTLVDARVLLVATYRSNVPYERSELADNLARLEMIPQSARVGLRPLSRTDSDRLVENLSGRQLSEDRLGEFFEVAEGNPFFIEQLVQRIEESGTWDHPDGWSLRHGRIHGESIVPQAIGAIIDERSRRLSAACRELLAIAACIGRNFDLGLLARVIAGVEARSLAACLTTILSDLEQAVEARLVSEVDGDSLRYRFTHAMIHEGIYSTLRSADRRQWHWRIGSALAVEPIPETYAHESEIARHLCLGVASGQVDFAILHCRRAAELALETCAYEAAVHHYREALDLLRLSVAPMTGPCAELLVALAEALAKTGDIPSTERMSQQAAELARQVGDPVLLARAALASVPSPFAGPGIDLDACRLAEESLERIPPGDSPLRAKLLARLASIYHHAPDRGTSRRRLSLEARSVADRSGDTAARLWALEAHHQALLDPAHNRERLAVGEEILALATRVGQRDFLATAHLYRAWDLAERGNLQAAAADMSMVSSLGQQLRDPILRWRYALWSVMEATVQGRWDDALRSAEESLSLGLSLDRVYPPMVTQAQLFALNLTRWKLSGLEAAALDSMVRDHSHIPGFRVMLAYVHLENGNFREAREQCDLCLGPGIENLPWDARWLPSISYVGVIHSVLGDLDRVAELYPLIEPYAELVALIGFHGSLCYGAVARCLGIMATALQRWDEARGHFARATAMHLQMRAEPWLAATYCDHADMLVRRGQRSDRDEFTKLHEQSTILATRLDMPALLHRLEQLKAGYE